MNEEEGNENAKINSVDFIQRGLDILEKQADKIVEQEEAIKGNLAAGISAFAIKAQVVVFKKIAIFLARRALIEKVGDLIYFGGLLRTLVEVWAKTIYLLDKGREIRSILFIVDSIYLMVRSGSDDASRFYFEQQQQHKALLEKYKVVLPDTINKFDYRWMAEHQRKKSFFIFPSIHSIFTDKKLMNEQKETLKIFPGHRNDPYGFYRHFSPFAHGHYTYYNHMPAITNDFWIITAIMVYLSGLMEAVEKEVSGDFLKDEINQWRSDAPQTSRELVKMWKKRRPDIDLEA